MSPYIFQKQNQGNSGSYKDDFVEKGETDSLRKENALSGSEDEDNYNTAPPKEKKFKQDYHTPSFPQFPNQRCIYTKTTEDKEKGMKMVTSVSVNDMDDSYPKITFEQSHEPLSGNGTHSSAPVTNIMKISCPGSHVKLELQEIMQLNTSGIKTTLVFMNQGDCAETYFDRNCERIPIPNNESPELLPQNAGNDNVNQNRNYSFTFGRMSQQTETWNGSKSITPTIIWKNPNYSQCYHVHGQQVSTDIILENPFLNMKTQGKRTLFSKNCSIDQFWDIPPPQEFADAKSNSLEDLTHDLASCRIGAHGDINPTHMSCHEVSACPISVEEELRTDFSPSFDQLSESDNYEPMLTRPSISTNRSSFTKDFINYQKKKSWVRNNSIATIEHRASLLPKKRRQTFPRISKSHGLMQEDLLLHFPESFSSLIMCQLPLQSDMMRNVHQGNDHFPEFGEQLGNNYSSQSKGSSKPLSEIPNSHKGKQSLLRPLFATSSDDNYDDIFTIAQQCQRQSNIRLHQKDLKQDIGLRQNLCEDTGCLVTGDCGCRVDYSEIVDSGYDQEMGEVEYQSPEPLPEELSRRSLAIQVIPPSCSGSEEQMLQSHPVLLSQNDKAENASQENSDSGMTVSASTLKHSESSLGSCQDQGRRATMEYPNMSPTKDINAHLSSTKEASEEFTSKPFGGKTGNASLFLSLISRQTSNIHTVESGKDSDKPAVTASCPARGSTDLLHHREQHSRSDKADRQTVSRCK